jgi:hypothetical protein
MAAGDATVTALQNILKTKYDQKKLYQLAYADSPLFGKIRKDTNFGGNNARITLRYGAPQGGSMVFATAQTNKSSSSDAGFLLTRAKDYHVSGISGEALLAAEGDENTLLSGVKGEIARSIQLQCYRNGGGARGQISAGSTVGNPTITLSNVSDIVNFEVGMVVNLASTDGTSGAIRVGTNTITAMDRQAGTLTTTTAWTTGVAAAAASDYIFRNGDFGVAASGLAAWIPTTAPTSSLFFGVDRSVDTSRLGGVRYTAGAGGNKEEILIDCSARLGLEGGTPDAVYLNNLDRAEIVKGLGSKAVFEPTKSTSDGVIGYKALILEGDKGPLRVMADNACPKGTFYMLQEDTWVIKSIKPAPHVVEDDGLKMIRETTSDGVEWRLRALWQMGCEAPGFNAVGSF